MAGERSWMDKVADAVANTVYSETVMTKAAQGSAEISQSLFHQSDAYVPYGAGQQAIEVEGPQQSFQDKVREATQGMGQEHGREQEMDR
jgi:hypothetical protein